jgi:hypothetical protein
MATFSVATEAIWTLAAHVAILRRSNVCASHSIEARISTASICVCTLLPTARVAGTTCAAVLTWSFVIADRILITVVFSNSTCSNLFTCAVGEHVTVIASTVVGVGSHIRAVASVATRIGNAIIDIRACLTIAFIAIGTIITAEPFQWCRLIMACHTLEARLPCTVISVTALLPTPSVARATCAAVLTRPFVIADRILITVIFSCVAR